MSSRHGEFNVAKVKSRISVSQNSNGVTIHATGCFAMDLVAALSGKTVEELRCPTGETDQYAPISLDIAAA
jgi:hypothetical protein